MQVRELRVGNWVNGTSDYNKYPMPLKVQALTNYKVYFDLSNTQIELEFNKYGECNLSDFSFYPIPLTSEILEKAGFEICITGAYEIGVIQWSSGVVSLNGGGWLIKCEYVHQLQNLYFALTGEELEINLH